MLHTGLLVKNKYHRPYPRKKISTQYMQNIIDLIESELPKKYQNSSLLLEWKEYGENQKEKSRVTCLPPPPPKMPIHPFTL